MEGKNEEKLKMTLKFLVWGNSVDGDEMGRWEEEQVWGNMGRDDVTDLALSTLSLPT